MIELPPTPDRVEDAVRLGNQLAYGFEKHGDVDYWRNLGYANDPGYFWKRILGWQAGGDDVARFGLYANPPSAWNTPAAPPSVPPVPDPQPTNASLERLIQAIQEDVLMSSMLASRISLLIDAIANLTKSGLRVHL